MNDSRNARMGLTLPLAFRQNSAMHPIEAYCLKHSISILSLATRAGLDSSTLYKIVDGSRSAGFAACCKIRAATEGEVSADDLVDARIMATRQNAREGDNGHEAASNSAPEGAQELDDIAGEAA